MLRDGQLEGERSVGLGIVLGRRLPEDVGRVVSVEFRLERCGAADVVAQLRVDRQWERFLRREDEMLRD